MASRFASMASRFASMASRFASMARRFTSTSRFVCSMRRLRSPMRRLVSPMRFPISVTITMTTSDTAATTAPHSIAIRVRSAIGSFPMPAFHRTLGPIRSVRATTRFSQRDRPHSRTRSAGGGKFPVLPR